MEMTVNTNQQVQRKEYERIEAEVTAEVENALLRYLEIQKISKELEEEKARLQEKVSAHLSDKKGGFWYPVVKGIPLKVRYFRETEVEYDETALRFRLGEKYRKILKPDLKKIRLNLRELEKILEPVIDKIGSPDRDMVKNAIEIGALRPEDFAGAFKKQTRTRLAVMRFQQDGGGPVSESR
ncbi:MAG TPA: hypothetical protein DCZ94_22625 [Lentisphaeria bacterium]|nr:MAG: hypothetical protein A2X48_13870 [Lentisphaerae bacterium GWF2_49_21]HBC89744.1 hypothetical protein [Lentisphaeria bacterium]